MPVSRDSYFRFTEESNSVSHLGKIWEKIIGCLENAQVASFIEDAFEAAESFSGLLALPELLRILQSQGLDISDRDCGLLCEDLDIHKIGGISFEQFLGAVKKNKKRSESTERFLCLFLFCFCCCIVFFLECRVLTSFW